MPSARSILALSCLAVAPLAHASSPVPDDPAPPARAPLEVGLGAGVSLDLPDRGGPTRLGPGAGLEIPVRLPLTPHASLRARARLDYGGAGHDRVSWAVPVDGELVRFHHDDHFTLLLAAGATVGPELTIPLDAPVQPYVAVGAGLAWLGTYHSFGGDTAHLLDPAQNDLDDPTNIDPYTSQLAVLTEAGVGLRTTGRTRLWGELGYTNAWAAARPLARTPAELDARREPYGWNALRVAAGVAWSL